MSQLTGISSKFVGVHVNDLYEAWRHGLLMFTSELDTDPVRKARVQAKAARFFVDMGIDVVRDAIGIVDAEQGPSS